MNQAQLVLASSSVQRKALLQQIGLTPQCIAADIDETPLVNEAAVDYVQRLAREKCHAVLQAQAHPAIVMGADTCIVINEKILGKPADKDEALQTLSLLSATEHRVMSGVAVSDGRQTREIICQTTVRFRAISSDEMLAYWHTGEPRGKAGSYAIQGLGAIFVESIHGSYSNVVGLPLQEVSQQLAAFGYPLLI